MLMDYMLESESEVESEADISMAPRRSTRSALSELMSGRLSLPVTPVMNVLAAAPTPSPSPDELVIQLRGRRKIPVTWSPDIKRTPIKMPYPGSPTKSNIVLRSTPRKRLLLGNDEALSPEKTPRKVSRMLGRLDALTLTQQITPQKKKSPERLGSHIPSTAPLGSLLKGLSHDQLVELLLKTTQGHPELEQEVRESLPQPDLRPVEEQLSMLKKNIFKCLPTSRLTSKFDSPAFNRASTHVNVFKKAVVDGGRHLVDSQNYGSVIEYVVMAWNYVKGTPTWENSIHNTAKRMCFKTLASYCMTAIKNGTFTNSEYQRMEEKLEPLVADSDEIQSCLKQISVLKAKAPLSPVT